MPGGGGTYATGDRLDPYYAWGGTYGTENRRIYMAEYKYPWYETGQRWTAKAMMRPY